MYLARTAAIAADGTVLLVTYVTTWQTRIAAKAFTKAYRGSGGQIPVAMVLIRDGKRGFIVQDRPLTDLAARKHLLRVSTETLRGLRF